MRTKVKLAAWRFGAGLLAVLASGVASRAQAELFAPVISDKLIFTPPHVAGDAEFNGNGPSVFVKIKFSIQNNSLVYTVYFKATETKSDWTEASGWSPPRAIYTAPAGMRIDSLPKSEYELLIATMSGHADKAFVTPLGRVTVSGDTYGDDAGVYTKILLNLDATIPMNVTMNGPNPEQTIPLPSTVTYTPPHTRGDKEFNGNGPRVVVDASIQYDTQAVFFVVQMIAEETKPDSTTASGLFRTQIYTVPPGRRITEIVGETNWPGLVSYYDTDHDVDMFTTPLGPVSVFGDHRGDDAGTYTKVVLSNINKSIVVRTAPSTSQAAPSFSTSGGRRAQQRKR